MKRPTRWMLSLLPLLALAGCAKGPVKPDPEAVAALRERFVLGAEPADAVSPLDWREAEAADESDAVELATTVASDEEAPADDGRVALVGKVGGMPNPFGSETEADFPWIAGHAVFFLVDAATADEFADHAAAEGDDHAADCPFCSREAANKIDAVVTVVFADESGEPAPIDARDLFGLEEGDLVVVRGVPKLVGDLLVVEADGLFPRG